MPDHTSFDSFEKELNRLVESFGKRIAELKSSDYTIFSLSQIPVRKIDFKKSADKSRHDKLVMLVDKMLILMPKLRSAVSDREKAALQNAVTATDQQIDQLVYELYGLTEDEIKLVEDAR